MKKILFILIGVLICLSLFGCSKLESSLTNEQIIAQTKECEAAGLDAVVSYDGNCFADRPVKIYCQPRRHDETNNR
jgi:hypothetical protein